MLDLVLYQDTGTDHDTAQAGEDGRDPEREEPRLMRDLGKLIQTEDLRHALQQVRSALDLFLLRVTIVTLFAYALYFPFSTNKKIVHPLPSSLSLTRKTWGCLDFEPAFSPLR